MYKVSATLFLKRIQPVTPPSRGCLKIILEMSARWLCICFRGGNYGAFGTVLSVCVHLRTECWGVCACTYSPSVEECVRTLTHRVLSVCVHLLTECWGVCPCTYAPSVEGVRTLTHRVLSVCIHLLTEPWALLYSGPCPRNVSPLGTRQSVFSRKTHTVWFKKSGDIYVKSNLGMHWG